MGIIVGTHLDEVCRILEARPPQHGNAKPKAEALKPNTPSKSGCLPITLTLKIIKIE